MVGRLPEIICASFELVCSAVSVSHLFYFDHVSTERAFHSILDQPAWVLSNIF